MAVFVSSVCILHKTNLRQQTAGWADLLLLGERNEEVNESLCNCASDASISI